MTAEPQDELQAVRSFLDDVRDGEELDVWITVRNIRVPLPPEALVSALEARESWLLAQITSPQVFH